MSASTFRERYCERFGCQPEDFEDVLLWHCYHSQCRLLARAVRVLDPEFFQDDFELIHEMAQVTSLDELKTELTDFRNHHSHRDYWRGRWHMRLSGQKLTNLGAELFRDAGQTQT